MTNAQIRAENAWHLNEALNHITHINIDDALIDGATIDRLKQQLSELRNSHFTAAPPESDLVRETP